MIVQCDQCSAKFRLDDAKLKEGGVKVRCSKCSSVFVVKKESPGEEADYDSFLSGLMPPPRGAESGAESALSSETPAHSPERQGAGLEPKTEPVAERKQTTDSEPSVQSDFDLSEFSFDDQAFSQAPPAATHEQRDGAAEADRLFGELDLDGAATPEAPSEIQQDVPDTMPPDDVTFNAAPDLSAPEFDVSIDGLDLFGAPGNAEADISPSNQSEESSAAGTGSREFTFDSEAVVEKAPETGRDILADSSLAFTFEPNAAEPEPPSSPVGQDKGSSPATFDFSQFNFGDEPETEAAGDLHPPEVGLGVTQPEWSGPGSDHVLPEAGVGMQGFDDELPPLSISSRRKESSALPIVVTVICILLVLALTGGGFYLFKEGPAAFEKIGLGFIAKWLGVETKESGSISVRNATGMFLVNREAGEVFVVTGEAVNNFSKPRASIQVKVTLFGPKGAPLAQKTAYCGNPLSRDQLVSMPLAEMEKTMSSQFGASLSNVSVQSGKSIPFVVVMTNVPKETVEFGVEVAGSTIASK